MGAPSIDYKKYSYLYILFFLTISSLALSTGLAFFYIVDPLQLFHKSFFYSNRFMPNMREQAAGIINNYEFDSVILGTSMLENTSSLEASKKLGGTFVNISMSGSSFYERSFVLTKVLEKKIKYIIYSLDTFYLDCTEEHPNYPAALWAFLYDDIRWNDFKVYFNKKFLLQVFTPAHLLSKTGLDRPNAWFNIPAHAILFGGIENWVKNKSNEQVKNFLLHQLPTAAQLSRQKNPVPKHNTHREKEATVYIDTYLISIISQHPETMFYLIFPPYYKYTYASMRQNNPASFFLHQHVIMYLVKIASKMKNIQIYGFEDEAFTSDIANYKDTLHYHQKFNSYFLDAIAHKEHLLTPQNIEAYLKRCEQQAYDFDLAGLNAQVQRLLQSQEAMPKE